MALTGGAKGLLISGFLITGAINTLTKKWQFQTCSDSLDVGSRGQGCPVGEKKFDKPWTQNIIMFMGEALVMSLHVSRRHSARAGRLLPSAQPSAPQEDPARAPFYIFLLPAACDVLGTGIGGVGMMYISASVWQMMRGSLIVFTSFLSVAMLGRTLECYKWCAVAISTVGLALIGCSAILDQSADQSKARTSAGEVFLGIGLTILSQFFAASQMVIEEKFVKGRNAPPEQVVGSEGLWGILVMIIVLFAMYWIPGGDSGSFENAADSLHMLGHSAALLALALVYLVSIAFFNFFGVTISGKLSAVHRTINDALRTSIVWAVSLLVYYVGDGEVYGVPWMAHSWLQLLGFACLILGSLTNHAIVKLPFVSYASSEASQDPIVTPTARGLGVSLTEPPEQT